MPIKIIITLFCLYNIYKLILRFKDSNVTLMWFLLWNGIWFILGVVIWLPQTIDLVAELFGFTRQGIDLIAYVTIVVLVYAVYRITLKLEHLEYEVTLLVRQRILDQVDKEVDNKKTL